MDTGRECRFLGMLGLHVELSHAYGVLDLQQVGSIIRMCTRTRLGGLNRALQGPGDNGSGAIALKAFFIILVCPTTAIALIRIGAP